MERGRMGTASAHERFRQQPKQAGRLQATLVNLVLERSNPCKGMQREGGGGGGAEIFGFKI